MISTRRRISILMGLALGCSVMIATPSYAVPVSWTNWSTATNGNGGSATGLVDGVVVKFSGDLAPNAQTDGVVSLSQPNFWASNPSTYTSGLGIVVDNGPTPNNDIIRLTGGTGNSQLLEFSVPVLNPVMAILSLGRLNLPTEYDFDQDFTILKNGPGHFGNGTLGFGTDNSILVGREGHGLIQFSGLVSSISWTSTQEFWHGFTVGKATSVPEPASLMLLGAGLAAIGIWRRKAGKIG